MSSVNRLRSSRTARKLPLSAAIGFALMGTLAFASEAQAACTPTNPAAGGTVTCTNPTLVGNPFASNADNIQVNVANGAEVASLLGIGTAMNLGGNNVTLNNQGLIDPTLLTAVSVLSSGVQIGNANALSGFTLNNGNTGIIRGKASLASINLGTGGLGGLAVDGRVGAGGLANIVNDGVIESSPVLGVNVLPAESAVIAISGPGRTNLVNNGTITGRVALSSNTSAPGNAVTNTGAIHGSVYMGEGNDSFTAQTGSVVDTGGGNLLSASIGDVLGLGVLNFAQSGVIDGGAGVDALNLVGAGEDTASAATYQNFETLNVNAGRWHINGLLGSLGTNLNGGTAVVNNGADLGPAITADGGALEAELNPVTVTAPISLGANGLTVQGDTQPLTLAGSIGGSGGLTKNGAAELDLTAANTYAGGTALNAGTLGVGDNAALGTGALAVNGPSTVVSLNPGGVTLPNAVVLGSSLAVAGANPLGIAGPITGPGNLVKGGTGELTLSGANTYAGGTDLNGGTLTVQGNSALGTGDLFVSAPATLRSAGPAQATLNNTVNLASTLTAQTDGDLELDGAINGNGGLTKTGAGRLILNGTNGYAGPTTLDGGTLALGQSAALGAGPVQVASSSTLAGAGSLSLPQDIGLSPGAVLTFDAPNSTLSGVISGLGGLDLAQGMTALNGLNTYEGGTTIEDGVGVSAGTSQAFGTGPVNTVGAASLTAPASVSLANPFGLGGALSVQPATGSQIDLSGPISGPGSIVAAGPGDVRLSGASTYTGGTTAQAGTLVVSNDNALGTGALNLNGGGLRFDTPITLPNDIVANADTAVDAQADVTTTGAVSGSGDLIKQGLGTLTLDGSLAAYTGDLVAQTGALVVGQAFNGSVAVGAGANLNLSAGDDHVSLSAPLEGALNLGDGNDSLDVPVQDFGSLTGTVDGGAGANVLNVTNTGDGSWAPGTLLNLSEITIGSGANVNLAAGINRLTDTPLTTVNGGLRLDGALGGDIHVTNGGSLVGSGTVGGNLINDGQLAPGGLPGNASALLNPTSATPSTLQVNGNLTTSGTSNLTVRTAPDGTSDKLNVAGAATLNGGQVTVLPQQTGYGLSTTYDILDAAGGVGGTFSGVTQTTLPFLSASLTTRANGVDLILGRNDNTGGGGNGGDGGNGGTGNNGGGDTGGNGNGGTGNNGGGGTDGNGNGGTGNNGGGGTGGNGNGGTGNNGGGGTGGNGDPGSNGGSGGSGTSMAYDDFPGLSRNQRSMANALQRIEVGEITSGRLSTMEPLLMQVRGLTSDQVKPAFDSLTGETQASLPQLGLAGARQRTRVIFDTPMLDPSTGSDGRDSAWVTPYGVNLSLDGHQGNADLSSRQRGLAVGWDHAFDSKNALGIFLTTDRTNLDAKGRPDDGTVHQTGVGLRAIHTEDNFWVKGTLAYGKMDFDLNRHVQLPGYANTAHSDPDGHVWQAGVEAGWPFQVGGDMKLTPIVGVYHAQVSVDGRQERGAGLADLQIGGQSQHETLAAAGAKLSKSFPTTGGGQWTWEGSARLVHNFDANSANTRVAFASAPDQSFTLAGNSSSRQWVEAGAGVRYAFNNQWSLGAHYDQAFGGSQRAKALNVSLSMNW